MAVSGNSKIFQKPVLVTGAAGFIGVHTVRALRSRGCSVRALVHRPSRSPAAGEGGIEVIIGDILDAACVERAVAGSGGVVHCAAMIRAGEKELLHRTNVEGTRALVAACERLGVKSFVFMSTPQVEGPLETAYGVSKRAAEDVLRGSSLDWTILRPVLVYGPGDAKDLTLMARLAFRSPVVPILGSGRELVQPVYVSDVAAAAVRALEKDVSKRKTFDVAGPHPLSLNAFIDAAARVAGRRCLKVHIPLRLGMAAAFLLEKLQRRPVLTREVVRRIGADKTGDVAPLCRDLGVSPISIEEGLRNLFASPSA